LVRTGCLSNTLGHTYRDSDCYSNSNTDSHAKCNTYRYSKSNAAASSHAAGATDAAVIAGGVIP
jgi:hypothetical protein